MRACIWNKERSLKIFYESNLETLEKQTIGGEPRAVHACVLCAHLPRVNDAVGTRKVSRVEVKNEFVPFAPNARGLARSMGRVVCSLAVHGGDR